MEFLQDQILQLFEENQLSKTHRVKLLVWRSPGGKYGPTGTTIEYMILSEEMAQPFYVLNENSYEVELFKDHYITSGLLSTLKTNNKAINVLGSIFANENDYDNCLLLNEKKQVVEALNGNLFLVKGYTIKTAPLSDGCLNGILRKQLLKIIAQLPDYILEEDSISPFELQKADELFVTNTIAGIQPITKYRKKEYNNEVAKELLAKLNVHARLG